MEDSSIGARGGGMTQRVLVTGGAGYIGSHTVKALAERGYDVVVYDNLVYGHAEFVQWGPLVKGDLLDASALDQLFRHYGPFEAVLHFAAYAYVGESVQHPEKYYRNNITGSLNLFEKARENGTAHFIFSSTCATYGIPETVPIPESHPQQPINPYGFSKLAIEKLLWDMDAAYGTKAVALRYFNAAGADPEPASGKEIGEDHNPETHLIPLIFDAALKRRDFIGIFGTDYDTEDGTAVRDYIHVTDLAEAHVLALEYLRGGGDSQAFNLGNGLGFSVRQVLDHAQKIVGSSHPIPIREEPRRAGDPPMLVGSADKARQTLGWSPRYSDIDAILAHAWQWHQFRFGAK